MHFLSWFWFSLMSPRFCFFYLSMQRTMISWWLLKEKKITLLWRCRCLQVPHASVDGPHWWIHWHIYWTWYLSFLYVASANILTKCNLVRKRFIFCLWYQITTYHLGNQCKNLKPRLLAILYKIASSERRQFTAKKMEQGQRRMWLTIWLTG